MLGLENRTEEENCEYFIMDLSCPRLGFEAMNVGVISLYFLQICVHLQF